MPNVTGRLGSIQGELYWRLIDFCRIHQIVYEEIAKVDAQFDALGVEHIKFHDDPNEIENIHLSRLLSAVIGKDRENKRIMSFVDGITVVGLWAIAEQFLGKIYRGIREIQSGQTADQIRSPYRWDQIRHEYQALGIDLAFCENFVNADECRVLNNAIKHDPTIGGRLLAFPYFQSFAGQQLEEVPLELQRYVNGVSDFLGSLIERGNALVISP